MKQEIKDRWITALTDGSYKQGYSFLQDRKERFCCLGVLCDLYRKDTGEGEWGRVNSGSDEKFKPFLLDGDKQTTMLPVVVLAWAELEHKIPKTKEYKSLPGGRDIGMNTFSTLAQLNDGGYSFAKIAEIINSDL